MSGNDGNTATASAATDLLGRALAPDPPAFALLHRPETTGTGTLDVLVGTVSLPRTLADIPVPASGAATGTPYQEVLALLPYRQIAERGFDCADDGAPLLALAVTGQQCVTLAEVLRRVPDAPIELRDSHFDVDDPAYADIVRKVITDEIGTGKGANFVIKRSFTAEIGDFGVHRALAFFRRLLEREQGAYWTFIVHTGDRTFVGASPERHVSLAAGTAVMNPISGTYRYPASGPTLDGVMTFLADRKEAEELYMVVDEELKMMARICERGGRVVGPYLKEMARLAHTEYFIEGHTDRDPRDILRETMFAPTVTGSPLESACRVIAGYEPHGRGYYSGVAALIGRDAQGGRTLDSSILIRTAEIEGDGRLRIGVGATLVRHSDPDSEVAETRAKAAGLVGALEDGGPVRFANHPRVRAALAERNAPIADFWLADRAGRVRSAPALAGRRALVVDAEDTFTAMIEQQLLSLGLDVTMSRFDEPYSFDGHDFVVMGPGPGDPRDTGDAKITHLRTAIRTLLDERKPFLAVCLSHQVLCTRLGLELRRRDTPNQGVQREIDLFGVPERVGFYNTFAAHSPSDKFDAPDGTVVEVSRDPRTGEVHALRAPHFTSMQFHAESVLTQGGPRIVATRLTELAKGMLVV
ncbi:anthranilate synthase family protein [Streptomyces sp. NPDC052023]|uniref:anthranilate synthase family protein n=1 Tax=Streptomyces sp. NPDC052023 TaxID=3365681 RepID=UPI0037D703FC